MAPNDGYYFHNDGCNEEYSPLCQLDVTENSELILIPSKFDLVELNAAYEHWIRGDL